MLHKLEAAAEAMRETAKDAAESVKATAEAAKDSAGAAAKAVEEKVEEKARGRKAEAYSLRMMDELTGSASPIFGTLASDEGMPTTRFNERPVQPQVAAEMIREYLSTEGNAHQNLCTFVQTYMEPEAVELMSETLEKNAIDKDEYPMTADLENRCVQMLGSLWHADPREQPMGTSTVGSSEACMLGGLAMLFRWKELARSAGIDVYSSTRPNLVISSGYQVCWEKFCRYWDVEMRLVPMDEKHLSLNLDTVLNYVDDHTIGVVAILGITYTGRYDDVAGLDKLVGKYNKAAKVPIRIHVDGASGAMVAPFIEPHLKWDFRLPNVWSISTSGHKYGLVYPGIGWVLWRSKEALPEDLIFWVSYLGGQEATMAINFSRSASQIVAQYYVFMRNGMEGYREIHQRTMDVAHYLVGEIKGMGLFEMLEEAAEIPILCWRMKDDVKREWTLYDLDDRLRMHGWQIPAYPLPENMEHVTCQRIVCRADLSMAMAIKFVADMKAEIAHLDGARVVVSPGQDSASAAGSFDHSGR